MATAVSVRLQDLEFVVDELEKMNSDAANPLVGKIDVSRIAVAGHSMGGVTALLALEQHGRFRAGILIDAGFTFAPSETIVTPAAILAMGRTQWSNEECSLWGALKGPRLAVNFLGADHMTPTDGIWIAKGAIAPGDMGSDKTISAVRDYVAAFFDAHLRNQPWDPLLLGPSSKYPSAIVTGQNQGLCQGSP
jgi:pimeloyl-ACP methyl ester carboxylesterase